MVYESRRGGHYPRFVRLVAEAYLARGWRVFLAGPPEVLRDPEAIWPQEIIPIAVPGNTRLRRIWEIGMLSRRNGVSLLFLPFLDGFFFVLPLLCAFLPRSCLVSGIIFQANYAYPSANLADRIRSALKAMLTVLYAKLPCVDRIFFLDILAVRFWKTRGRWLRAFRSCPDPADGYPVPVVEARSALGLAPDLRIVASLGRQDERKGTLELISAFASGPGRIGGRRLVLAGECSPEVANRLSLLREEQPEVARRLIVAGGYLPARELNLWANSADAIAVVHPSQIGSSGTLVLAARLKKPVVASDYGAIGVLAREYALGRVVRTSNIADLAAGLEWAFSGPKAAVDGQERLAAQATEAGFMISITMED